MRRSGEGICFWLVLAMASLACGDDSSVSDIGDSMDVQADDGDMPDGAADAGEGHDGEDDDGGADGSTECDRLFQAAQAQLEAENADASTEMIVPGMILALDVPACGTWLGAVGDSEVGVTPMTTDRVMNVASITKTFVAAVVLRLAEEGLLELEDTLVDWRTDIPNASTITIRQLLGHRAGVRSYTADTDCSSRVSESNTPDELLACISGDPADFPPGTAFGYSATGYVLLGLIVEAVTGNDLHSVIRERFLDPLGLTHTSFGDEPVPPEYAHSYSGRTDITGRWDFSWAWASGDMRSSALDMLVWIRALAAGEALEPSSQTEMQTFLPIEGLGVPAGYGLGLMEWDVNDADGTPVLTAVGHRGAWESVSIAAYVPELDAAVVLMINHADSSEHGDFVLAASSRIVAALSERIRALTP